MTTEGSKMTQFDAVEIKARRQHQRANVIIRRNMLWSMGAGLIPVPFLDSAVVITLQVKMLGELSECYDMPFRASSGKAAVSSLLCSLGGESLGRSLLGTSTFIAFARSVPVIGIALSALTMPVLHGALTYALGRIFQQHFAAGGTILTFDPKKTEAFFRQKIAEGMKVAASPTTFPA